MAVTIVYAGNLAQNDVLVIDPENDTATLNGQDVSDNLTIMEQFELQVGANTLEYSDSEGSRTLSIEVAWRPRYA